MSEENGNEEVLPNAFDDLLNDIKEGDRKKYNSVEDALKSITPAQQHIKALEEENQRLKGEADKAKSVDELLAKLEEKANKKEDQPQGGQVFDESKLSELVTKTLSDRETKQRADANVDAVIDAFKTKYGDKAEEAYNKVAREAGIDGDTLKELARKSPLAVLRLGGFDAPAKANQPLPTKSNIRADAFETHKDTPTARVPMVGYNSKQLVDAWRATKPIEN